MKQYKFELIRTRVVTGAAKEIEMIANEYSKEGGSLSQHNILMIFYASFLYLKKKIVGGVSIANKIK